MALALPVPNAALAFRRCKRAWAKGLLVVTQLVWRQLQVAMLKVGCCIAVNLWIVAIAQLGGLVNCRCTRDKWECASTRVVSAEAV